MRAEDVTDTPDLALQASGCDQVQVEPRLLSDNGSSYVSEELAEWLQGNGMKHSRGAPYHPQTQGKIERWHQTLNNRILLENYFLPGDLEAQMEAYRRSLQPPALPREPEQRHTCRCLLRAETIEYSGCTYTDELKDGHPHGQGTLTCSNDTFWNLHELIVANSRIVNEASIAED